jgi:hypothetical protein
MDNLHSLNDKIPKILMNASILAIPLLSVVANYLQHFKFDLLQIWSHIDGLIYTLNDILIHTHSIYDSE